MEQLRKWVQTLFIFLTNGSWEFPWTRTIYQGPLKVVCSPGLNCYSCPAATTYCPIGALQQLMAGIRLALENGQYYFGLYIVGTIGVIGSLVGRMVCGWACPFGLFQELLHKLPGRKFGVPRPMRFIKFAVLALMVVILPLFAVDDFGLGSPWFCKYLCPAGTLEAGLPMVWLQPSLRESLGWLFVNKLFFFAPLCCLECVCQPSLLPHHLPARGLLRPVRQGETRGPALGYGTLHQLPRLPRCLPHGGQVQRTAQ